MSAQGKMALVTGAAGFIGGWLAERLARQEGVRVRGLVRPGQPADFLRESGVEVVEGDVRDAARMGEVAAGCQWVFHAAAWLDAPPDADLAWATNVAGTQNLLAASAHVERFLYLSSIMVYGAVRAGPVDEDRAYAAWHPRLEPYGATKVEAERLVFRAFRESGLPATVIRPANVFGPRASSWVPRALRQMRARRPLLLGGGRGFINPVYVENLVDAVALAVQHECAVGEAFNISDGLVMTWLQFYERLGQIAGCRPRSIPAGVAYALAAVRETRGGLSGQVPSLTRRLVRQILGRPEYSIDKARRGLGYQPRVGFEEAMGRTEAWYRDGVVGET